MKSRKITIIKNNIRESAKIEYEGGEPTLTLTLSDGIKKSYTDLDLYGSFGLARIDHKNIKFLCKGAKISVHTSGMSSQMSNGLVAYELIMGQSNPALVYIFDYEENDLTNDIQEQHEFCMRWADST
ncbi:hypothetical protein GNF76_25220 [Pseudomonas sp. CCM 7893]|uniref:Uncharacterized protein n=1 Tax=Pseudomonas spelaei TaxID=1055469 RepID=A0A6I3WAG5_9PSED|nr:hypothetical protein [Pseudomonas spelaei]MUF07660.1 hypothetical protein [Pseudomonas spelaei]